MTQVMGVRAARWISSLVACGLVSVALHISGTTSARAAMAQDQAATAPELREIIAAVPRSWPPQYGVDEDGNPIGFAIDVMEEIAALAGLRVIYHIKDSFLEATKAVRDGRADIIPNMGIIPEREVTFAFTAPVETFRISIFVRGDTLDIKGMPDLTGRRVAVVKGNVGYLRLKHRKDMDLAVFEDVRTALFELVAGQVDALVYPQPVIMGLAEQIGVEDRIRVAGEPLFEVKRGISVHKDNTELLAVLDKAVERFVGTPAYERIYVKWFGRPMPFWTVSRVMWTMGGLVIVVMVAAAGWRYQSVVKLNRKLHATITGRKRAEEAKERLSNAIENVPVGIALFDGEDRLAHCNSRYRELVDTVADILRPGVTFEEIVRTSVARRPVDAARGREEEHIRERMEHHRNPTGAFELCRPERVLQADENRMPDGGTFVILSDITERKRAEAALRESDERFRTIAANIPGNVYRRILHPDGRLTWAYLSAGLRDILELDPDAVLARPEVLIETVHPEDRARWQDALRKSAETLEPYDLEFRRITPSSNVVWLRSIARPHRRENGDVVWDGVALDITEQKEAQTQLIQASKLATLGEMASGIAHEINQPLCVVGMAAELSLMSLEEGEFDTEFVRKKLQTIVGQKERMAGIVNHMRLFSRRDTTGMEWFNPVECVADAVGLVDQQFRTSGIELKVDLPAACRIVCGHPVQLEQVVLNLLNNARDAVLGAIESAGSGKGRPVPRVRVSLVDDRRRKTVVISVTDNGGGIPIQTLERIFDPFFTTKKEGHGTGLGLSIGYSIIDAMGGSLEAQNADGGVEFRISVPAAVEGSGAVDRRSRKKIRKAGTRKCRSDLPRVLFVDDEETIVEEVAEYLRRNGYDVAVAGSGLEALELHRSRPADVVITDLFMPEMNGNELIRRLRRTHPDLPIMVMTGHTTFGDEKETITEGASVVLKKPISLRELSDTLSTMVRH